MNRHLFLFTIGPVQSFIEQARKTQDLYAGSFLLSHLINSTMEKLKQSNNCEFIFPHETLESKPNRFIAIIESNDIANIGNELKEHITEEFQLINNNILNNLKLNAPNGFKSQIETHFQVNWTAIPLDMDNYADTYKNIESHLGAIKNVRNFVQLEEIGRKCSLCGEKNVLFYHGKKRAYTTPYAKPLNKPIHMHDGEGLCTICFTKRFAYEHFKNKYKKYPSTAEIALMDLLDNLNKYSELSKLLNDYKNIFHNNFDEQLFYEDNLTEKYFKKYNYSNKNLKEIKEKLKKIYEKAKEKDLKFYKYYAIIMLDGDDMGKWLSGEFLEDKTKLKDFHKKLAEELGKYVKYINNEIITKPKGKLVYAGGDDVFAFINLNHLLPIIKELRIKFPKFEELGFKIKDNKKSSASIGVAIAHYKTPLPETLKWARNMEDEAKSIDSNKDAVAIAVLKHSGEIRKTVFKFQYNLHSIIEILDELIMSLKQDKLTKQNKFSNTFIKNLSIEFRPIMDEKKIHENNSLIKTEMNRLIGKSCMLSKKSDGTKNEINNLTEKLYILYANSKSFDNFLFALDIVDFMKREGIQ
jgi:CRISPR-associated protein Cmr2